MNLYQETFLKSVELFPSNTALSTDKRSFTYQQLDVLIQKWSRVIQACNERNFPVAIYGGKQWQMYAGILSVLAVKQTYVPLNNKQPTHRNQAILEQIDCQLILIAEGENPSELLAKLSSSLTVIYLGEDNPIWLKKLVKHRSLVINEIDGLIKQSTLTDSITQSKYAYILFTSGSTGTPKGIAVSQQNVINYIARINDLLGIESTDKVGQFFELSFDLSVHDLFSCWSKGAALYVIPAEQLFCPTSFIRKHQLTVFSAVASILSFIDKFGLLTPNALPSLRICCFGGEKLLTNQVKKWQMCASNSRVFNLYGPTEFTISSTFYEINIADLPRSSSVPIGKALPGLTAILIKDGKQVNQPNILAELFLAGDQIVEGYWKDDKKTAECFTVLEGVDFLQSYFYRTGDIVYYDENGCLVFHGRNDHQFKVAGHRVEAADIEACILSYSPSITWCTVKAIIDDFNQQTQIVAHIESSIAINKQVLRKFCLSQLPQYMVPDAFNCYEYLPRNANGKVDLKMLSKAN